MTREQLQECRDSEMELRQLRSKIKALEGTLYAPGIQQMSGMPRAQGNGDGLASGVLALAGLRDLYNDKIVQQTTRILEVEEAMEALPVTERVVMRYRYVDAMRWERIADRMHYSVRQLRRIHDKAITSLLTME